MSKSIDVCLSFDFDAISLWVGPRGSRAAPLIARGEFGVVVAAAFLVALTVWIWRSLLSVIEAAFFQEDDVTP